MHSLQLCQLRNYSLLDMVLYPLLDMRGGASVAANKLVCSTQDELQQLITRQAGRALPRLPHSYWIGPSNDPDANCRTMGSSHMSNSSTLPSQTTRPCAREHLSALHSCLLQTIPTMRRTPPSQQGSLVPIRSVDGHWTSTGL